MNIFLLWPWTLTFAYELDLEDTPELSMGLVDPCVGLGWVHYSQSAKIWKEYVSEFKALSDKFLLHQTVRFDFTADLTGTGNRSEEVKNVTTLDS